MRTASTTRKNGMPTPGDGREFHCQTCSYQTEEARFRARLLPLLFIALLAPLSSSFLPLEKEHGTRSPEWREREPNNPGPKDLPKNNPTHEPNTPQLRIALR